MSGFLPQVKTFFTTGPLAQYRIVRLNADETVTIAQANNLTNAHVFGLTTTNTVTGGDAVSVQLYGRTLHMPVVAGLTLAAGDVLYLSGTTAGKATNVVPGIPVVVGVVVDASQYSPSNLFVEAELKLSPTIQVSGGGGPDLDHIVMYGPSLSLQISEGVLAGQSVMVSGRTATNDGGGGQFIWTDDTTTPDDGGTIVVPNTLPRIGCWKRVNNQEDLNVLWFGADPTGVADSAPAIAAAIAARAGYSADLCVVGTFAYQPVLVPRGRYAIKSAISADTPLALAAIVIKGDGALFTVDPGIIAFGGVGPYAEFHGINFQNGECAISIKTANQSDAQIIISRCKFECQTGASIRSNATNPIGVGGSRSTQIEVFECVFLMSEAAGGYCGEFLTGDSIQIHNCTIDCKAETAFYLDYCNAYFNEIYATPGGAMSATGQWIKLGADTGYGAVVVSRFRFGGEAGGAPLLVSYSECAIEPGPATPNNAIRITESPIYTNNRPAIVFYKLPNVVQISDCEGYTTGGIEFKNTIDATNLKNFAEQGTVRLDRWFYNDLFYVIDSAQISPQTSACLSLFLAAAIRDDYWEAPSINRLKEDQLLGISALTIPPWGNSGATNVTGPTVTGDYGVSTQLVTATANNASLYMNNRTFIDPTKLTPYKIYTLVGVFQVHVATQGVIPVYINIGGARSFQHLSKGKSVVCTPFVYLNATGVADQVLDGLYVEFPILRNTDQVQYGRFWLIEGAVAYDQDIVVLEGTIAPAGYTTVLTDDVGYAVGDLNYRSNVAAGGFIGDVCTTAGIIGSGCVFKTFGAITL
jgi:hypothetical protein